MFKFLVSSGLILFFQLFSLHAQEKLQISFNPEKNTVLESTFNITTSVIQEFMGINQQIDMKMLIKTSAKVDQVSDSGCIMEIAYKRLAVESRTPTDRLNLDTESIDKQPGIEYLLPILNRSFFVSFNKSGEVINVEGLGKIISEITSGINAEPAIGMLYENMLNETFGVENIKNYLGYLSPVYPGRPIEEGSSWTNSKNTRSSKFLLKMESVSTLKAFSRDLAMIQTYSKISTPSEKLTNTIDGMDAKIFLKGNQIEEAKIAPLNGIALNTFVRQNINGHLWINLEEQNLGNMKVPIEIKTEIEIITDIN